MGYIDHYEKYMREVVTDMERCKSSKDRIVFGYTSDVDVLVTYSEEAFNEIIKKFLKTDIYCNPEDVIDGMESFARIIAYYMSTGIGGEADIVNGEVCEYLIDHFETEYALGGTGAQGAAALGSIGMPLLVHISDKSEKVCEMMDYPGLESIRDGRRVPVREVKAGESVYHMIFSYTKGDKFKVGEKEYTVPVSNRVIMGYDTMHKDMVVADDFKEYLENHADNVISYNLSGFNAILDPVLTAKRMEELGPHYRTIKEKNPDCIIYFESAHYLNPEVKHLVYKELSQYVNIMGMNEDELVVHTKECGVAMDHTSLSDVLMGMDLVIDKYQVNGIILHTKDYSMYYGDELVGVDVEKGLTIGNLLAGTKARVGHYGTLDEVWEGLDRPLSEAGLAFVKELEEMSQKRSICLVPSRYMEKPLCTIGLGDTFVAGVQFAFIK